MPCARGLCCGKLFVAHQQDSNYYYIMPPFPTSRADVFKTKSVALLQDTNVNPEMFHTLRGIRRTVQRVFNKAPGPFQVEMKQSSSGEDELVIDVVSKVGLVRASSTVTLRPMGTAIVNPTLNSYYKIYGQSYAWYACARISEHLFTLRDHVRGVAAEAPLPPLPSLDIQFEIHDEPEIIDIDQINKSTLPYRLDLKPGQLQMRVLDVLTSTPIETWTAVQLRTDGKVLKVVNAEVFMTILLILAVIQNSSGRQVDASTVYREIVDILVIDHDLPRQP